MRMKTKTLKEVIQFKNGKKRPIIDGNIPVYGGMEYLDMLTTQTMKDALS